MSQIFGARTPDLYIAPPDARLYGADDKTQPFGNDVDKTDDAGGSARVKPHARYMEMGKRKMPKAGTSYLVDMLP